MNIKIAALILLLLAVIGISGNWLAREIRDAPAKKVIAAFIQGEGLNIEPGTNEYENLMAGILLGDYPELTAEDFPYIRDEAELRVVMSYVWRHSRYSRMYKSSEADVPEATMPEPAQ